jgi:hypothetical protein
MTTKSDTVEKQSVEEEDGTPLALRTWGLSGQPARWAPETWIYLVETIRRANTGNADLAAVQSALDTAFPDAGYQAADVTLAHPPTGLFSATVTGQSVRVDLDGDQDLLLPDENVVWDFGDGTTVHDAGGWDHEYADPGEYTVRLEVLVAGTAYTEAELLNVGGVEPAPERVDVAHAERDATVFESETDDLPNNNAINADVPDADDEDYDPSEHTVDEVLAYLDDHPDEAKQIRKSEKAGKGRVGILDKL